MVVRTEGTCLIWLHAQDLVTAVLALMGLKADAVSDEESLANLGIDSMQLTEVPCNDSPAPVTTSDFPLHAPRTREVLTQKQPALLSTAPLHI